MPSGTTQSIILSQKEELKQQQKLKQRGRPGFSGKLNMNLKQMQYIAAMIQQSERRKEKLLFQNVVGGISNFAESGHHMVIKGRPYY